MAFRSSYKQTLVSVFCIGLGLAVSGCSSFGYLLQAGRGQLKMINRARPIPEVLKDERVSPRVRALLTQIPAIKKFGEDHNLKATSNYVEYVQLDQPAASWIVSACEPLKFRSKEWKFPIVGSFPYLGWFDLDQAKVMAKELREEGWDVDLRGAAAYSTLGWFKDPVVSSMIPEPESTKEGHEWGHALGGLVNVVLHESVHATFYISGQAFFDESIANYVADQLTEDYLTQNYGAQSKELTSYLRSENEYETRRKSLHEAYEKLNLIYQSSQSDAEKKSKKEKILAELTERLKPKYPINNATLIQFKTYHVGKQEFDALFQSCGRSWQRFWGAIKRIHEGSFGSPQQEDLAPVLMPLAKEGCR